MKISVITPNYNGDRFLARTLESVVAQHSADAGFELEYIVVDGGSTDTSPGILHRYAHGITALIREPDQGPADAINKGLQRATGDVLAWLNADDTYTPDALARVAAAMTQNPDAALCFGHCTIVDEHDCEIRRGITRFKQFWYPLSSRFTIQTLNYVSQPALFFRRSAWEQAGPLRTDLTAAWDYDLLLRLWRSGRAVRIGRPPLAAFRWTAASISGTHFETQFREELEAARTDAGRFSPQVLMHQVVRYAIIAVYRWMARRQRTGASA